MYLAARLRAHQGPPAAAIAAMRTAIAYRETHMPYSPGTEEDELDVVVLAQLLQRTGQSAEARAVLERFGATFAEFPHLRAQLAIVKLELWPHTSDIDLRALQADLATFAYEDPRAAKRWQRRFAQLGLVKRSRKATT